MKIGGQIPWNVTPICETSQIYYLMGRRAYERRFGQPFKGPIIPFGTLVEYYTIFAKDSQESISLERKSYLDCSSDTLWTRVEFGRVTYWLQTLRSWRRWTHRKPTRKDSMRKKWYFPNKENLFFQSQMDESKFVEEIRKLRTSTFVRHRPIQGESNIDFLGESEGCSSTTSRLTHFRMPVKLWTTFGPCREASHTAITLNPESNFTRREKNHSLFHWSTLMYPELQEQNLDVKQERRMDDCWNLDGSRDLSDSWTGLTQFTLLDEKTSRRIYVVQVRLTRK